MTEPDNNPEENKKDTALAYQQALEYGKDLAQIYAAERARRQELEAAHQLLRAVFASTPDGLVVIDEALYIRQVNPAFVSMLGLAPEEILNKHLRDLPLIARIANVCEELEKLAENSILVELTFGSPIEQSWSVNVAQLDAMHHPGWVIVLHDQTQRKLAEEALQVAHDELEQRVAERTAELRRSHVAEQQKTRELAVLEERQRLARELHDAVSQTLWSASLLTDAIPDLWVSDPDDAQQSLSDLRQLIHGALAEMRTLLVELRPERLVKKPFNQLVKQLTKSIVNRTDLSINTQLEHIGEIPADVRVTLYRIIQEALNNIIKHSSARRVNIFLESKNDGLTLRVRDDGRGFEPEAVPPGHMGLSIMKERMREIGGNLKITSTVGNGTEITARWQPEKGAT